MMDGYFAGCDRSDRELGLGQTCDNSIKVAAKFTFKHFSHHGLITNSLSFLIIIIVPLSLAFMGAFALFPKSFQGVDLKEVVVKSRVIVGFGSFSLVGYDLFVNIFLFESIRILSVLPHTLFILLWIWFMISRNLKLASVASVLGFMGSVIFCGLPDLKDYLMEAH